MTLSFSRHAILPALVAAALALPAAAEDAHHPPGDTAKPPATQPASPRAAQPGMQGPGGNMMGNMMQMMQQMMSGMMQNQDAMHRMRMMGMDGMGMMQGRMSGGAIEHAEGHIAFLKAELKITAAQEKAWADYAETLRANAKQLSALAAESAKAPAAATPVDRIALQEKSLTARLEIARRTKPALTALYAALADDQKKIFGTLAMPRMGMQH